MQQPPPLPGGELDLGQELAELNSRGRNYPVLLIPPPLEDPDNVTVFLCPVQNCKFSNPRTPHRGRNIRNFLSHLLLHPSGYYFLEDPKGHLSQIRTVPTGLKFNVRLLRSSSGKTFFSV
ncbi:hypothetical protein WJX84_008034, partial [Apatococcus fuscideae]